MAGDTLDRGRKIAESLGLRQLKHQPTYQGGTGDFQYWYRADAIHRLLGEGQEYFWTPGEASAGMVQAQGHTHRALAIDIRPIKPKDTAEGLLKEMVNKIDMCEADRELYKRVKAYLASVG